MGQCCNKSQTDEGKNKIEKIYVKIFEAFPELNLTIEKEGYQDRYFNKMQHEILSKLTDGVSYNYGDDFSIGLVVMNKNPNFSKFVEQLRKDYKSGKLTLRSTLIKFVRTYADDYSPPHAMNMLKLVDYLTNHHDIILFIKQLDESNLC